MQITSNCRVFIPVSKRYKNYFLNPSKTREFDRKNEWKKIYIARLKAYKYMLNLPRLAVN